MKKIPLEKLIRQSGETDYQKQYNYIIGLLETGKITPVKAAASNGRRPALPVSFWLREDTADTGAEEEELKYHISLRIRTDYYLHHMDVYRQERVRVRQLNDFLERMPEALTDRISVNERSFQIWGREKFLRIEQGKKLLKHCGLTIEDLNVYDTTEPLAYYSASKGAPQGILVIENKDTYYTFRNYLMSGGREIFGNHISTVIYGAGKGIYRSIADLDFCMEDYMKCPQNEYLYFGDLDYEGLGIYEHLAESLSGSYEIKPFTAAYERMLEKAMQYEGGIRSETEADQEGNESMPLAETQAARGNGITLPETKDAQNRNLSGKFMSFFAPESVERMEKILESGRYIPQEIITIQDLR